MIKKRDLIKYFWTYGNLIATEKGVELEMHGDSSVQVSVMLRNVAEIEIDGLEPMVQLSAVFEDFEKRFWMFQGYHTRTYRTRRTSWLNLRNSSVSQKTEVWQQVKKLGLQIARLAQERIMLGMK